MFLIKRKRMYQTSIYIFFIFSLSTVTTNVHIKVPTSYGELIDKITILEIKTKKIDDEKKLNNIRFELEHLKKIVEENIFLKSYRITLLKKKLRMTNTFLWVIEDLIREHEYKKKFGNEFIFLARCVYHVNDIRAQLKRAINQECNSAIIEEKCYRTYR